MAADPHIGASILASAAASAVAAMLDAVPLAAVVIEPGTARTVRANPAAHRLAGGSFQTGADTPGRPVLSPCTDAAGRRLSPDELPSVRAARGERLDRLRVDWHLAGGVRSLLVSSAAIPAGETTADLVLLVLEDVTAAADRAPAPGGPFASFFDGAPVGHAMLDRDLRIERVNGALARMDGVPVESHAGRSLPEVLPGAGGDLDGALRSVLATARPVERTLEDVPSEGAGGPRHWLVALHPVCDGPGDPTGVGVTVTDITDRVEAGRRATFLARAGEVLGRSLDLDTTLGDVASIAVPERADWCIIDLLDGGTIRRVAIAHDDPDKVGLARTLTERYPPSLEDDDGLSAVLRGGPPVLIADIDDTMLSGAARDAEHLEHLRAQGFVGALIAPLRARGRILGAITFAFSERRPGQIDLDLATDLARRASTAIDNAQLFRERSEIARTLQRSLLPPRLPRIEGFEVAARYRAAGSGIDVGGDFYDVFPRSDTEWIVALGDVCGKGAGAAALTGLARYTLRAAATADPSPEALLRALNDAIIRDQTGPGPGDRYMTAIAACLDLGAADPVLTIGAAGHPPMVLVRASGEVEILRLGGRAVGLLPGIDVGHGQVTLGGGDALILYTDGVLDAGAPARPLDVEDVARAAAGAAGSPAAMATAIERAALDCAGGAPRDDIAIVVLRRVSA